MLPGHPGIERDLGIKKESEEEPGPGGMGGQIGIELGCDRADLGQTMPRNRGEVVVFVMISDIERQDIQLAVVAEGFLITRINEVVPLNPAGAQRMQADGKEKRQNQIGQRPRSPDQIYGQVDANLYREVRDGPRVQWWHRLHPKRAHRLEKWIEHQPERLPQ